MCIKMFLIYTKNIECVWKKVDTKKICLKKMLIMYLKKCSTSTQKCFMYWNERLNVYKKMFQLRIRYGSITDLSMIGCSFCMELEHFFQTYFFGVNFFSYTFYIFWIDKKHFLYTHLTIFNHVFEKMSTFQTYFSNIFFWCQLFFIHILYFLYK